MTWCGDTKRCMRRATLASAGSLFVLAGCASDHHAAILRILSPDPDAVFTTASDANSDTPGLQIDVKGESRGLQVGTQVEAFIDDEKQEGSADVDPMGNVLLQDVTLPPGTHLLSLRTSTGSLQSDEQQYTFRAIEIAAPLDGQTLRPADDEDLMLPGVQIAVSLDTYAIDPSEEITLLVDGEPAGATQMPDVMGKAVFSGVTIPSGDHTIGAVIASDPPVAAEDITVRVRESCAEINFISPKPPATGNRLTLGGADLCPADTGAPFEITVQVSTDAGNGQPIQLFVNGQPVASGEVQGASIAFEGVALTNLASANTLRVEVMNSEGVTCTQDFPADIFVDCAGPDCTFAGPTPVDYVDAGGDLTLFLNAGHRKKGGFDIAVDTDQAGQKVSLIVDRDERSMIDLTSVKKGTGARANFKAVKLAEGPHYVEGRCEDDAGNVNFTGEVTWVVDTVACGVEVTGPAANTLFVPADDDDANPANGTQTVATSTVDGDDCTAQRAGTCDPATGLTTPDFVPYDGTSPLLSTVTLDPDAFDQTLCVEVEDRAQNVGRGTLDVQFRSVPPTLEIESPADGESFNALGNAGRTQDAVTASLACDANFSVACTEVGDPVDLHFDDAMGAVFATATCTAPGPTGFAGRAEVTKAFDVGGQTATIVATQSIDGNSGEMLVGSSAAITISGDCVPPGPTFSGDPCEGGFIGIQNTGDTVTKAVVVLAGGADTATVTLGVSNTDGTASSHPTVDAVVSGPQYTFNAVALGGAGMVTVTADVVDDFGNVGQAMCTATIVTDVPTLVVTAPTASQQFGPGGGCNAGAGVFGVQVTATVDTDVNRRVTVAVNGGTPVVVPITGGTNVSACVPVPDDIDNGGASMITVRVESTASGAFKPASLTVNVHTVDLTDPIANQVLAAGDDCDAGAPFGYAVLADVDAAHMNASFAIASPTSGTMVTGTVTGGTITGCLDLAEGPQTIEVSIGGTVYDSVDVVVASMAPGNEIVLTKTCPNEANATYRTDPVHLSWSDVQDYPGQFASYTLRCAHTPVVAAASADDWWNNVAANVTLGVTPPTTAADIGFRVGETRYCALRAADGAGQLTPITGDTDVTCKFREVVLVDGTLDNAIVGVDATPVGDVNGDGIDDALVGGSGRAFLFFGKAGAFSGTPDVTFTAPAVMGRSVAGIGDFNGDGRPDFAIGWRNFNSARGQVFIFFGRPMTNLWPPTVDLNSGLRPCDADICIKNSIASGRLGSALSPAGKFASDGDASADLAIGAGDCASTSTAAGSLYIVRGKGYEVRACASDTDCRPEENCGGGGLCNLDVAGNFWGLDYDVPTGNWLNAPSGTPVTLQFFRMDGDATVGRFGCGLAAFGAFDATAGDDLVVSAPSTSTLGAQAQLFFLSGRAYTAGVGLQTLTFPSGTAFDSGRPQDFGLPIAVAGNVFDDPGAANPDTRDLLVKQTLLHEFWIYPGDSNFAPADRIQVTGPNPSDIGISLGSGFHPTLSEPSFPTPGVLGDLDGDGLADLCAGSGFSTSVGAAYLWYADAVDASAGGGAMSEAEGSRIEPAAAANTVQRIVRYAGDLTGDGQPDIVVGDPNAATSGTLRGRASLLY